MSKQYSIFQITQMSSMSVVSIMTTVPIAIQTPMAKVFGEKACHIFWAANFTYKWKLITSGLGMAIYRLICFKFLFERNLDTKSMARKIMTIECIVVVGAMLSVATLFSMHGWEKAPNYQECMDMGHEQVKTLSNYNIDDYNDIVDSSLRIFLRFVVCSFTLLELLIYLWIIYQLQKHDEKNFEEKIITDQMRRERNQKNIITLRGQVISFLIEIIYSIYVFIHNSQPDFVDASTNSISLIICSTIISLVQILTSHEMMRFVKRHFSF